MTAPCSERVVFPDYGISVMLPPYEDVTVDLPASEPGQHAFTCQMQMLHGRLIVDRRTRLSRSDRVVPADPERGATPVGPHTPRP